MEEELNYPGNDRDDKTWNKEAADIGSTPGIDADDKNNLEKNGPNKSKPFNVLHQDGSFADYAEDNRHTNTNQDGTLGLGT